MTEEIEEVWAVIPDFPDYMISNMGRIYNERLDTIMRASLNNYGYLKITLVSAFDGKRHTRSVAYLVANQFVDRPDALCDQVVLLDGDLTNVAAHNMVMRPRWFAWKYFRQLRTTRPRYYENLPVCDVTTGMVYESIVDAGMSLGLLFKDIWDSTYNGRNLYPNGSSFQVVNQSIRSS